MSDNQKIQFQDKLQYQEKTEAPSAFLKTVPQFDQWRQPWAEPVRTKIAPALAIALMASGLFAPVLNPNTQITQNFESRWHYPWSEPVRVKQGLLHYLQDPNAPDVSLPPPVRPSQWYMPLSEPTRPIGFKSYLQDINAPDVPNPPPVLASQWFEPWVDPVRIKAGLATQLQQSFAWANFTPAAVTTNDIRWIYPWSDPTRRTGIGPHLQDVGTPDVPLPLFNPFVVPAPVSSGVTFPRYIIYQESAFVPLVTAAATTDTRWIYPWSEPTRRVGLGPHLQDVGTPDVPNPPPVLVSQWSFPWNTPPAQKFTTSVATFDFTPVDNALTNFWYAPWPDFASGKKSILAAQQQVLALNPTTPTPAVFTDIRWAYPWSTPTAPKVETAFSDFSFIAVTPAAFTDTRWIYPWSEPVRFKVFGPHLQDVGTPDVPNPPPVLYSQWAYQWTDPVRVKPGLPAGQQQFYTANVFPLPPVAVTDIRWFEPWVDPVRTKLGLLAGIQQSYTSQIQPPPVLISQWNYAWSEPVRQKSGLGAQLQQALAQTTPFPSFIRTINWFAPFTEPVRQKKGLWAALQQFFDTDHKKPPAPSVTVTMSAFEINLDSALFGITVYDQATPIPVAVAGASVTITEIPAITGAAASIEET